MKIWQKIKTVLSILLWGLSGAIIAVMYWAYRTFGKQSLLKILFHLQEPLEGSNVAAFLPAFIWALIFLVLFAGIGGILQKLFSRELDLMIVIGKIKIRLPLDFWNRHALIPALLVLVLALVSVWDFFQVSDFLANRMQKTKIYEEYYVEPSKAVLTFPEQKRNLIYIYLESMENTYMSQEHGGAEYAEFIPELYEIQMNNTNFAVDGHVNGAVSIYGTEWTMGALVAQSCGIPLNMLIDGNALGEYTDLYPGAYSLGQILEQQGYNQVFMMGSAGGFAGRDTFFRKHGNYEIMDYYYAIDAGWIDPDYYVWWGYEDEKLFDHAKKELLKLADQDAPFNFTLLTVDTHFVGGYSCELCEDIFGGDQYANVIACSSRQVNEFVHWIEEQEFYSNTTIVICGDHPTMDMEYMNVSTAGRVNGYTRKVYTAIINPVNEYELDYDRQFATIDMYPTTLASLGVQIEGERLALGTNLFSEEPTLIEIMGSEQMNAELAKCSKYYEDYILYGCGDELEIIEEQEAEESAE